MPHYKIEIFKGTSSTVDWSNVYHAVASTLDDAVEIANDVVFIERDVFMEYIYFFRMRVTVNDPGFNGFTIVPLTGTGTRGTPSFSLPLWNTFRVDFLVDGGRPSRKFLRGPVLQSDQNGDQLTTGGIAFIAENYVLPMTALFSADGIADGLVDESGNVFSSAQVHNFVQMRQMHRRRRATGFAPPS